MVDVSITRKKLLSYGPTYIKKYDIIVPFLIMDRDDPWLDQQLLLLFACAHIFSQ